MAYSLLWVMQDVHHQPYGVQFLGSGALESRGMLLLLLLAFHQDFSAGDLLGLGPGRCILGGFMGRYEWSYKSANIG